MTLHEELTAAGYTHVHYAEDWVDYGNGETGPMVHATEAYDEYENATETVYVEDGVEVAREPRDLALEAFVASFAPEDPGH